ncbi:MAG: rubrerythrin family protein [Clostridia bacterium]|nr:rubrerythrin family protein [Clostridia bacterium]MBR6647258.1 rubrerythrin family protein [Clostridia bacterium]
MDLKGSKTENNLMAAFAGESMARNKYTYFAAIAKEAGYEQIADIFRRTADNEKEHAEIWFKLWGGLKDTEENLKTAAEGERSEWTQMYAEFAKTAEEEGFTHIAKLFENVGLIEKEHEQRYRDLIINLQNKEVFKKKEKTEWICRNCGYVHSGEEAPLACPVCTKPQGYFEVKAKNY